MTKRRARDASVDAAWALFALAAGLTSDQNVLLGHSTQPAALRAVDVVLGVACFVGIWIWRRQRPVAFAIAAIGIGIVSTIAGGIGLVCVFTVAQRRPWRTAAAVGALACLCILPALAIYPVPHGGRAFAVGVLSTVAATGWGMYARARAQLLASLHRQLLAAEKSARESAAAAERAQRERIAREMHDMLAHRLSLLAVHAGALEFNRQASVEEIHEVAGVIRTNTHQALDELRQVIGLLRTGNSSENAEPSLADVPALVEESRSAGLAITFSAPVAGDDWWDHVPASVEQVAYRVIQEALTNVRKHAPHTDVRVDISREGDAALDIRVRNAATADGAAPRQPGQGAGLIGLRERVTLSGGRIDYGRTETGGFQVHARLPYAATLQVSS